MRRIKKIAVLIFTALASISLNALPGIKPYLDDVSGEYVYYKDSTFPGDASIGFLYYDDSTYAVRFYQAANKKPKSVEKDITLYISVNPQKDFLEMTGETIKGSVAPEDTEIINYMHDLFYEFVARRQKALDVKKDAVPVQQDFAQFGGNVKILFNSLVPIFNIESITKLDGAPIFSLQTTGRLVSSSDTSFDSFKGIKNFPKDKKRNFKNKAKTKVNAAFENQSVTVDELWEQKMENFWVLGDYALMTFTSTVFPEQFDDSIAMNFLVRSCVQSTSQSYALWANNSIKENLNSSVKVMNVFFQPDILNVTRDFKIITKTGERQYSMFILTIFEDAYQKNTNYFESILDSYKCR